MTSVRYHSAALCSLHGGQVEVSGKNADLLADGLLLPPQELQRTLEESLGTSEAFYLLGGRAKTIVYRGSSDPFLEWIVHGRQKDNPEDSNRNGGPA